MNAVLKRTPASYSLSTRAVELRKRVEELENARTDACLLRDREAVELIDKQIMQAIEEWSKSFVSEGAMELRKTG